MVTTFKPRPKRAPPAPRPSALCVAALVYARQHNAGRVRSNKVGWEAMRLGLLEEVDGVFELNMRGQDVADEAIALSASKRSPK